MITRRQFLKGIAAGSAAFAIGRFWNTEASAEESPQPDVRLLLEENDADCVAILGARGSMPVSGKDFLRYGGSTLCVLARLDGEYIILDAGTGMAHLPQQALESPKLTLLLSHPHADHLLGLPMCPYLMQKNACLEICAEKHAGLDTEAQIRALFSPPLWPVDPSMMAAKCSFRDLEKPFRINSVLVEFMQGVHPGGVSIFRLTGSRKTIVFATDNTLTEEKREELLNFAQGCDLLMIDGQYSDAEWSGRETWGHSRWKDAARFGHECGAKAVRILHHDPTHTDELLDEAGRQVKALFENCSFAGEGETIRL